MCVYVRVCILTMHLQKFLFFFTEGEKIFIEKLTISSLESFRQIQNCMEFPNPSDQRMMFHSAACSWWSCRNSSTNFERLQRSRVMKRERESGAQYNFLCTNCVQTNPAPFRKANGHLCDATEGFNRRGKHRHPEAKARRANIKCHKPNFVITGKHWHLERQKKKCEDRNIHCNVANFFYCDYFRHSIYLQSLECSVLKIANSFVFLFWPKICRLESVNVTFKTSRKKKMCYALS